MTPEIIDNFSNAVWVDSTGLLEPQARNQYMVQAGKFGCDCIIILDTDEYLEFPLGIEFFKRQLDRIADKNPNDLSFCVCLLYTSPSPRDVEESRMPSSA